MNLILERLWSDPLIQCLGWTLLHFLWQGIVLAGLFAMSRFFLRSFSANARYLAGNTTLLLMVFAITITFCREIPQSPVSNPVPIGQPAALGLNESRPVDTIRVTAIAANKTGAMAGTWERLRNLQSSLEWTLPWVVVIWILGVGCLSLRLIAGGLKVHLLTKQTNQPAGEVWLERLAELKQRLGISRQVRLLQSWSVEVPTIIGWFKPVILFPVSTFCGLSPAQIESLLLHELAHIRRHDYLVNLVQCVVETLLFYHPAVWWVSRCIRQERENCCDDLVVQASGDALLYAQALATMEEVRSKPVQLALAANGKPLLRRIRRLLGQSVEPNIRMKSGGGAVIVLLLMASLLALPLVHGQKDHDVRESKPQDQLSSAAATNRVKEQRNAGGIGLDTKPALYTRAIKIKDPRTLLYRLDELIDDLGMNLPKPGGITSESSSRQNAIISGILESVLQKTGVDLSSSGRQLSFNDQSGILMVRATLQELDKIEKFVQVMNQAPAQVTLECQIVELTGNFARQFHLEKVLGGAALYSNTNEFRREPPPGGLHENTRDSSNEAAVVSVLSAPQYRTLLETLKSIPEVKMLNLPRVTTLSSRQTQIKVVGVQYQEASRNRGAQTPPPIVGRDRTPGEGTEVGPSVDVVPYVRADGYAIEMTVIPTLRGSDGHSWQVVTSIALYDGQTELIQAAIDDKLVLLFTTPTIIGPDGNRPPEHDMPFTKIAVPPQPKRRVPSNVANRPPEMNADRNKPMNTAEGVTNQAQVQTLQDKPSSQRDQIIQRVSQVNMSSSFVGTDAAMDALVAAGPSILPTVSSLLVGNETSKDMTQPFPTIPADIRNMYASMSQQHLLKAQAAWTIGVIAHRSPEAAETAEVVPNLVSALKSSSSWVRALSAQALGAIGQKASNAIPSLVIGTGDNDTSARMSAVEALGRIGVSTPLVVDALTKASSDTTRDVSVTATLALDKLQSRKATNLNPSQSDPARPPGTDPAQPSGIFPRGSQSTNEPPDMLPAEQRAAVTGWDRVKISDSGEIFFNKKPVTLAEFATECQRLKQGNLGVVIYAGAPNRPLNPAQTNAMFKLVNAGVRMLLVPKESQLDSPRLSKTSEKINTIMISEFKIEADTMLEAAKQLTAVAKQNDPDRKGVNFIVSVPVGADPDAPFDTTLVLNLKSISLADAIERVCRSTGFEYSAQEHALVLTPKRKP